MASAKQAVAGKSGYKRIPQRPQNFDFDVQGKHNCVRIAPLQAYDAHK